MHLSDSIRGRSCGRFRAPAHRIYPCRRFGEFFLLHLPFGVAIRIE